MTAKTAAKTPSKRKPATIPVNERNLREAAKRLLSNRQIVSTEIHYIQRTMGTRATRTEIDETVVATRGLSWAELVAGE